MKFGMHSFIFALLLLSGIAFAENESMAVGGAKTISGVSHEIKPIDVPVLGYFLSIYNEYAQWGAQDNKEMLQNVNDAFGLNGLPFNLPIIGSFATGIYLLVVGHWGVLLYMMSNALLFVAVLFALGNIISVDDIFFNIFFQIEWISYFFYGLFVVLLAIGLSAMIAG